MLRHPDIEARRSALQLVVLEVALPLELFFELFVLEEHQETSLISFFKVLGQLASVVGVVTGFSIRVVGALFSVPTELFDRGAELVKLLEGEGRRRKDVPEILAVGFGRKVVQGQ